VGTSVPAADAAGRRTGANTHLTSYLGQQPPSPAAAGCGNHVGTGHPKAVGLLVAVFQDSEESGTQRLVASDLLEYAETGDGQRMVPRFMVQEFSG
jgi:hypothetical protein